LAFRYFLSRIVTVLSFLVSSAMSQTTPVVRANSDRCIVTSPGVALPAIYAPSKK
jgi:hypothetical protein